MTANFTSLSASMWSVHRAAPAGGSLQAIMVRLASTRLSILMEAPRRGSSLRNSPMWSCALVQYFFRTLWTVLCDTPNNSTISASFLPASAHKTIRARLIARADLLPRDTNASRFLRSWAFSLTEYVCFGISDSFRRQDTIVAFQM